MPFANTNGVEEEELFPGYHGRFIHSGTMTFVYWKIDAGAPLPAHSHPHEQVAHLLSGEFELTIDNETKVLKTGMVAVIPPNATHSGRAVTDCKILDAFSPIREDYLQRGIILSQRE